MQREESWALDGCGNSGPLSRAQKTLSEIAAIKAARDGVIHGVVSYEQDISAPIAGVKVEALGNASHFETITNKAGKFQLKVPAGQYTVRATKSRLSFNMSDISYENTGPIRIENGGCAQVQLVGVETSQ